MRYQVFQIYTNNAHSDGETLNQILTTHSIIQSRFRRQTSGGRSVSRRIQPYFVESLPPGRLQPGCHYAA